MAELRKRLQTQYVNACQEDYALSFDSRIVDKLIGNELKELIERMITVWRRLWFVQGVYEAFDEISENYHDGREVLFSLILSMRMAAMKGKRKANLESVLSLYRQTNPEIVDDIEMRNRTIIQDFWSKLDQFKPDDNLARMVVGQQALFILFKKKIFTNEIEQLVDKVNKLGESGLFFREASLDLEIVGFKCIDYQIWSELLVSVKSENKKTAMKPGIGSAERASAFMELVFGSITSRSSSDQSDIGQRTFRIASVSVGSGIHKHLSMKNQISDSAIAKAIEKSSDQNSHQWLARYISQPRAKRFQDRVSPVIDDAQSFQAVGLQSTFHELIGAIAMEELVNGVKAKAGI